MSLCNRLARCFSSRCDDWKKRTNYFKNHWNKETFGPVNTKHRLRENKKEHINLSQEVGAEVEDAEAVEPDRFWTSRVKKLSMKFENESLRKEHDKLSPYSKAVAAAGDLPRPSKLVCAAHLREGRDELLAQTASILSGELASAEMKEEDVIAKKTYSKKTKAEAIVDVFHPKSSPLVNKFKPEFKLGQIMLAESTFRFNRGSDGELSKLPSVTRILKETMPAEDKLRLQRWEEKMVSEMGREAFDKMSKTTLLRGERLHHVLDRHFDQQDVAKLEIGDPVSRNHLKSVSPHLEKFARPPLAVESSVVHSTLGYKGFADCVTMVYDHDHPDKSVVAVIDWKTSSRVKNKLGETFDNPLQIAAYAGALNHDDRYPVRVENGLIVVVYNDGAPATLLPIGKKKLEKYWYVWLQRLRLYFSMTR